MILRKKIPEGGSIFHFGTFPRAFCVQKKEVKLPPLSYHLCKVYRQSCTIVLVWGLTDFDLTREGVPGSTSSPSWTNYFSICP